MPTQARGSDANPAENQIEVHETLPAKVARLKDTYPDRYTLVDIANALGISKGAVVKYHQHRIPYLQVEGVKLFDAKVVKAYALSRRRTNAKSRVIFSGVEVERIQRICEKYYRQNLDIAPQELLQLARRVAKIGV
jgi:predicted transcriptional regulator